MAMIVQHNLTAMNSNRQLGVTTSAQAKSSEKLSSGYRINRAGDDAAGLKISEKMRSQVRGLTRASVNAQDGVSLIQTAEGALNEAHSILQRMNELAVQGANDTNESIDRDAINQELDQLTQELDRISTTTQFNKQNLLDGTFQDKNLHVGANANQKIQISIDNMNAETLGLRNFEGEEQGKSQTGVKPTTITYKGNTYTYDVEATQSANKAAAISAFGAAISRAANVDQYAMQFDKATGSVWFNGSIKGDGQQIVYSDVAKSDGAGNVTTSNMTAFSQVAKSDGAGNEMVSGQTTAFSNVAKSDGGGNVTTSNVTVFSAGVAKSDGGGNVTTSNVTVFSQVAKSDGGGNVTLSGGTTAYSQVAKSDGGGNVTMTTATAFSQVAKSDGNGNVVKTAVSGATSGEYTRYSTASAAMAADIAAAKSAMASAINNDFGKYLATEDVAAKDATVAVSSQTFTLDAPNVDSYAKANATITAVQNAINKVSTQRSALGALQNRLEHTIANLDNVAENTQAAESRIRDLDMASEMVEYSKNNILAQAGQSMLAQANQSTQGVLSLLQ